MYVTSVNAAGQGTTAAAAPGSLGKDDFLKLLAAQLQYQDPLNPMSNTEFIAQMAQFNALEQMSVLNESLNLMRQEFREGMMLQAVSLIGKEVTAVDDAWTLRGVVSKVNWTAEGIILTVNGQLVPLDAVTEVSLAAPEPEAQPAEGGEAPEQP